MPVSLAADSDEGGSEVVEEESGGDEDGGTGGDQDAEPDDPQESDDQDTDPDVGDEEGPLDPQGGDEDEEGTPGGDDEGTPGGDDDENNEPTEEPVVPGSTVADAGSSGSYYWWNDSKHGGEGAWKASVSYQNDWIRHQYLTLEVTRVDEHGTRRSTTVNRFYVPAGGTSNYESWDNSLKLHKGDLTGVLSVEVKVVAIRTSDENWATVSYATEGPTTVITTPKTP